MTPDRLSRYDEAAMRFRDVLIEHAADLKCIQWHGSTYPWDLFTQANPQARDLAEQVNCELNYELSEFQCSWAVVQFCVKRESA